MIRPTFEIISHKRVGTYEVEFALINGSRVASYYSPILANIKGVEEWISKRLEAFERGEYDEVFER